MGNDHNLFDIGDQQRFDFLGDGNGIIKSHAVLSQSLAQFLDCIGSWVAITQRFDCFVASNDVVDASQAFRNKASERRVVDRLYRVGPRLRHGVHRRD
ncbi:unannotated protein [freshwater metagenome]|uniref:Unannotated protein n=1 Tax=freshwater metagenome TaxID=449393 RepID=A0A6J6J541_9ZZZZ